MAIGAAFYHEANVTQKIESVTRGGHSLVAQLDLEPGEYLLWGKLSVGVNASGGYPPPAWHHSGGQAILAFGDGHDSTYVSIKPESGDNNETVTLVTAGKRSQRGTARLYFFNPFPLAVYVNSVRLAALQVERLTNTFVGESNDMVPEDPADNLRNQILRSVYDPIDIAKYLKGG